MPRYQNPLLHVVVAALILIAHASCLGATGTSPSTNPADFTTLQEIIQSEPLRILPPALVEVDATSVLRLSFDNTKIADGVDIVVTATLLKGTTATSIEVPGFVSKHQSTDNSTKATTTTFVPAYNKRSSVSNLVVTPSADIDLAAVGAAGQDRLILEVLNVTNNSKITFYLVPVTVGWQTGTSDAVMFIQRRGVSRADAASGINAINFAPAPGVTYGLTYIPRDPGFWRLLSPGIGLNVMFLDWKDMTSAFDPATGMFASGTGSSTINVGLGVQVSLFKGILQATYGWNLQAAKERQYLGIGVSFVNLATALPGLGVGTKTSAKQ